MVIPLFRFLYIRLFVVISHGKTAGASGTPTMQDVEKHCQRHGVGRAVVRCSERQLSHLSAYDEQAGRETCRATRLDSNRCARRCPECYLYQGWALFGSVHLFLAGTGQQDNTRPPSNVFVAEGEDSRQSDLLCGSMNHCCSQMTRTEHQTQVAKQ